MRPKLSHRCVCAPGAPGALPGCARLSPDVIGLLLQRVVAGRHGDLCGRLAFDRFCIMLVQSCSFFLLVMVSNYPDKFCLSYARASCAIARICSAVGNSLTFIVCLSVPLGLSLRRQAHEAPPGAVFGPCLARPAPPGACGRPLALRARPRCLARMAFPARFCRVFSASRGSPGRAVRVEPRKAAGGASEARREACRGFPPVSGGSRARICACAGVGARGYLVRLAPTGTSQVLPGCPGFQGLAPGRLATVVERCPAGVLVSGCASCGARRLSWLSERSSSAA